MSTHRLSTDLNNVLRKGEAGAFSMREIVSSVGERGYGLLLIILALPSAMPMPAPGMAVPFGIALFLIALQILGGRATPWLPEWVLRQKISSEAGKKMVAFAARLMGRIELWVRPRQEWLFGRGRQWVPGCLVLAMAILMMIPIPLTNTAPAAVVLLIGIGMVERDGILFGGAALLGFLAALFYLAAFTAIFYYGLQGMEEVKVILRGWFGR